MPVVSPQMPPLCKASSLHKIRDGVAFDGIGGLNMSVHGLRKLVKRQGFLFLFGQASHRFGIAFAIFGFEGLQLNHSLLFAGLLPNPHEVGLNESAFSSRNSIENVALLMEQTALTRCSCKEL